MCIRDRSGTIGAVSHEDRLKAFYDTVEKYPDIEVVDDQRDNDFVAVSYTHLHELTTTMHHLSPLSRRKGTVKSRSEGCQDLVRFFALLRICLLYTSRCV